MTNLSSISNTSEPFVNFQCSCTTPTKVYYNTPNPSFPREALNLMQSQLLTQPLSELNYCQECNAIKCNRCTTEQISFYYCPQCQFDVPSAAVSGEKIRCPRNCLECPICSNFLSIIEEVETQLVTEVDESNGKANINLYNYLYCEICRWDSRELNLTFDKVTHVSSVVEKTQQKTQIDNVEFKNLESHFDLKYMIPYHLNTHASLASIIPHPDFQVDLNDLLVEGKRNYVPTTKSKELEGYESLEVACKLMEDKLVDKMENLNVAYEATPFHQQMKRTEKKMYPNQPVYPQRQVLKCRKERSCRTCSTVLVRPHTKAAYLDKFKIKLPALTFVPHIFISQLPDLQPGKKVRVALKILNPLFYKVYLQLSSPCASNWLVPDLPPSKEYPHDIQFLSPKFFVDSFKEAWDDDDDDELKNDDLSSDEDDSESAKGILDRYYNTTTIGIDVVINGEPGSKVILPILMSYTFRLPKEGTDEQSAETKKSRKVTCHAWVYIRLGEVN